MVECSVVLQICDRPLNMSIDSIPQPKISASRQQTVSNGDSVSQSPVVIAPKKSQWFMCKICRFEGKGVVYLSLQKDLNQHTKTIHFCVFTCKTRCCGKEFSSLQALKKHKLTHDSVMKISYPCEHCDKTFVFTSELKNHQAVHSGDHLYKCAKYPYTFKQKGELTRHKACHSGKILHCDVEGCRYSTLEQRFLQEQYERKAW